MEVTPEASLWVTKSVPTQIQIGHGIRVLAVDKALLHFAGRDIEAEKQEGIT